jgi:hypothetical protein
MRLPKSRWWRSDAPPACRREARCDSWNPRRGHVLRGEASRYTKVIRIAIFPSDSGFSSPFPFTPGNDNFYNNLLRPVVDYIKTKDMYAIIDLSGDNVAGDGYEFPVFLRLEQRREREL